MQTKPKILLLFCGGTLSMTKNNDGSLDVSPSTDHLLTMEPRIAELADIDITVIDNINSSNADTTLRTKTGQAIADHYDDYDGFVITTGTDTMAYFSSALSFSLTNIGKPVILTGAQIPLQVISSDGRNNLINALRVATMDISGVFVVFGTQIIKGCRATKVGESELEAYQSRNTPAIGQIGIGIRLYQKNQSRHTSPLILRNHFQDNIISLNMFPGIHNTHLMQLLDSGTQGFILRGYGTGDIPDYLFPFLCQAQQKHIPIIQATQCRGSTMIGIYSIGKQALELGIIESYDMSLEAMTTKLMRCLGQGRDYPSIKQTMHTNLHGELDASKANFHKNGQQSKKQQKVK